VRGLRSKASHFSSISSTGIHDVLSFTETWLSDDIPSEAYFPVGYTCFRSDRNHEKHSTTRGGGVLCAVRSAWIAIRREDLELHYEECVWVEIRQLNGTRLLIGTYYVYPSANSSEIQSLTRNLELVSESLAETEMVILLGDFNIPGFDFNSPSLETTPSIRRPLATSLLDLASLLDMHQLNELRNKAGNTLDLVFSNVALQIRSSDVSYVEVADAHHHHQLEMIIKASPAEHPSSGSRSYDFRRADLVGLYHDLDSIDFLGEVQRENGVDNMVSCLTDLLLSSFSRFIPWIIPRPKSKFPHWFSPKLIALLEKKESHRRRAKKGGRRNRCLHRLRFCALRLKCSKQKEIDKSIYHEKLKTQLREDPSQIFEILNSQGGKRRSKNIVLKKEDSLVADPIEVAKLFADHFQEVYDSPETRENSSPAASTHSGVTAADTPSIPVLSLEDTFTREEVNQALRESKPMKSIGPDQIPSILIKTYGHLFSDAITFIFNYCFKSCTFPTIWKRGVGIPVLKAGSPADVDNYRIIVVLCSLNLIFERLIVNRLEAQMQSPFPSSAQHGFTKKRSTESNLAEFMCEASECLSEAGQLDVIYIDCSKAFDIMSHEALGAALEDLGVTPKWISFTLEYLKGREYSIKIGGIVSSAKVKQSAGVAQGSVTGPFMFKSLVNGGLREILYSKLLQFADDLKIARQIRNLADCEKLQADFLSLLAWLSSLKLRVNIRKTKFVSFTRKRSPILFEYRDNAGTLIPKVEVIRDLGVHMDSKLQFHDHVMHLRSSCLRLVGRLSYLMVDISDPEVYGLVLRSYILTKISYASIVWNNLTKADYYALTVILNKFCRVARFRCGALRPLTTMEVKTRLGLPDCISRCLEQNDILFLKRLIVNGIDSPYLLQRVSWRVPAFNSRLRTQFATSGVSLDPIDRAMESADRLCVDIQAPVDSIKKTIFESWTRV
jgi:hypothetical protein